MLANPREVLSRRGAIQRFSADGEKIDLSDGMSQVDYSWRQICGFTIKVGIFLQAADSVTNIEEPMRRTAWCGWTEYVWFDGNHNSSANGANEIDFFCQSYLYCRG